MIAIATKFFGWVFRSKKVTALLVGLVLLGARRLGLDVSEDEVTQAVALIGAYLVGQGIADAGKERAIIEAASKGGGS
jgi:hypothetical protein